jgi:hypothetical protein
MNFGACVILETAVGPARVGRLLEDWSLILSRNLRKQFEQMLDGGPGWK